jgi:hypothetical protein
VLNAGIFTTISPVPSISNKVPDWALVKVVVTSLPVFYVVLSTVCLKVGLVL